MEIDLFSLMKMNKVFKFENSTTTDPQKLIIIINKEYFKNEYIEEFGVKFIECANCVEDKNDK